MTTFDTHTYNPKTYHIPLSPQWHKDLNQTYKDSVEEFVENTYGSGHEELVQRIVDATKYVPLTPTNNTESTNNIANNIAQPEENNIPLKVNDSKEDEPRYKPFGIDYGSYKSGTLRNKWTVYEDPFTDKDNPILGLKGKVVDGWVTAPVIPEYLTEEAKESLQENGYALVSIPVIDKPLDIDIERDYPDLVRKGFRQKYAKKLVRSDYHGTVKITDMLGEKPKEETVEPVDAPVVENRIPSGAEIVSGPPHMTAPITDPSYLEWLNGKPSESRPVFFVDVGDVPPDEALEQMRQQVKEMKQQIKEKQRESIPKSKLFKAELSYEPMDDYHACMPEEMVNKNEMEEEEPSLASTDIGCSFISDIGKRINVDGTMSISGGYTIASQVDGGSITIDSGLGGIPTHVSPDISSQHEYKEGTDIYYNSFSFYSIPCHKCNKPKRIR